MSSLKSRISLCTVALGVWSLPVFAAPRVSLVPATGADKTAVPVKATKTQPTRDRLLVEAVLRHDVKGAVRLLKKGANPNARDAAGVPVLMVAVRRGDLPLVQELLTAKANPNLHAHDSEGSTALLEAVEFERVGIVKALLAHGANIEVPYRGGVLKGATPLVMAAMSPKDNNTLLPLLLKAGARVDATDAVGETALHKVTANGVGTVKGAELLLQHGATVDARDWIGMTPLMNAVCSSDVAMVKLLISRGADVNARCDEARREYGRAALKGDTVTMKRIEQSGQLNALHEDGVSVLQWTQGQNKDQIIQLLRQSGAK